MATSSAGSDTSTITTILVKDLSAELNKRDTLLEHFSQFGEVTRVQCRGDQTAIVHFKSHNDAIAAKTKGKKVNDSSDHICRNFILNSAYSFEDLVLPLPPRNY